MAQGQTQTDADEPTSTTTNQGITGGVTDPNSTVTGVQNKLNESAQSLSRATEAKDFYDTLIQARYDNNDTRNSSNIRLKDSQTLQFNLHTQPNSQIVDILLTYPWTIQKFNNEQNNQYETIVTGEISTPKEILGINIPSLTFRGNIYGGSSHDTYKAANVPFCYVTQWRQNISSNIMNIINSISAGVTAVGETIGSLSDTNKLKGVSETISKIKTALFNKTQQGFDSTQEDNDTLQWSKWVSSASAGIQQGINEIGTHVSNELGFIGNPATGSAWLNPYKFLYSMNETGKKYCFPMIANPPSNSIQNNFGDGQDGTGLLNNSFLNGISTMMSGAANLMRDFRDVVNFLSSGIGTGGYIGSSVEKAKYFNYPTNTQEYRITFPLLNTVNPNDWKKNYRFIILFMLRNLIFRKDNASYYPPLFYDLIIPGVIRQPFCYVGKFEVRPVGNVRTLGYDKQLIHGFNLDSSSNNFSVNVPEAWIVTITFTSLLATSANMVLSGLYDLKINTK